MRMRRIISSVAYPALLYFSTLFHKRHDFREKVSEQKYVFRISLQLLSKTCYILRRTERNMILNVKAVFMKNARYSCQILMKLEFFTTGFRKSVKYQISWQSVQWEAVFPRGRTDRQTDMTKLSVFFVILRKHLKIVCNKTWISVSRQEFFLFCKTFRLASQKVSCGFCPQGQSGRSTKLTTHFHLIPRLITSAAIRLNPLFAFTVEQRQIYVSELLQLALGTSRYICRYLTVVITQHQQNCLLCSIKHGYVFRPSVVIFRPLNHIKLKFHLQVHLCVVRFISPHCDAVGWGTALQAGRPQTRFPMGSLEFLMN
jgi:hypothetical protein